MAQCPKTRVRVHIQFYHSAATATVPHIFRRQHIRRPPHIGRISICHLLQYVPNWMKQFRGHFVRYDETSSVLYDSAETRRPLSFLVTVHQIVRALEREYNNFILVKIASHNEDFLSVYSYTFFTNDVNWQGFTFLQIYTRWSTLRSTNMLEVALASSASFTARLLCVCEWAVLHEDTSKENFL